MEAIFQCTQGGLISQTYSTLKHHPKRVYLWTKPIPHLWLFEKCSAILHNGGSRTVASALLTRKPQIICPVMFDQMFCMGRTFILGRARLPVLFPYEATNSWGTDTCTEGCAWCCHEEAHTGCWYTVEQRGWITSSFN